MYSLSPKVRFWISCISSILLVLMILPLTQSCQKDTSGQIMNRQPGSELPDLIFPADFKFGTFHDVTLDLSDAQMGVFRIYGVYDQERDLLGTLRAEGGRLFHSFHIPQHYSSLEVERYTRTQMEMLTFELIGGKRTFTYDFNTYQKTNTSGSLPANVLYAVNGQKEFFIIDLDDFSKTGMPNLLEGTIACAVDTVNDKMYYHAYPNMYEYDLHTNTHSVSAVNPNPFNGNYPRMEWDHETGHMFISDNGTTIHEVDPISGNTVNTYSIQGIVNSTGGGDLAFPPNGKKYLACFSGLYELTFPSSGNVVQAIRLSAENMPYQLTSLGYDRNSFLYAGTNGATSKLLKMDPNDGSFVIAKEFSTVINDLGSVVSNDSLTICSVDSDNDGICDELDDHPNDPEVAFDEFTPSELGYGSVAYEDMWPGEGDYDYNDLVIGYRYIQMRNTANELVRLEANFVVRAVGASYSNGFGFQLDIDPSIIQSVTGGNYQQNIVNLNAHGLEAGQTNPTIIAFESAFDVIDHNGGPYINTDPNLPISYGDTIKITVQFTEPQTDLSTIPVNPFIFVDGNRGHEVHLADGAPTALADSTLFGQQQDDSDPLIGRYYKTENNLPWGIEVSHTFRHPKEKTRIDHAYNYFVNWGMSAGAAYPDWYKDNSGYRNSGQIISF